LIDVSTVPKSDSGAYYRKLLNQFVYATISD